MKRSIHPAVFCLTLCVMIIFSSCKKSKNPGDEPQLNISYPTKVTWYDGNNSSYPTVWDFTYNDKNELTRYGVSDGPYRDISAEGVSDFIPSTTFDATVTYFFTGGSIYDGLPTEITIDEFVKYTNGTTTSRRKDKYSRAYNPDGLLANELPSGKTVTYSYDENKNLKQILFVDNSGVGNIRMTVKSLDGNPSPYVAVKGWKNASYPQSYTADYAFAYCHNNPIQIIVESNDPRVNTVWTLSDQYDFSYVYNENGYPTTVSVKSTYFNTPTPQVFTRTYNFTYK